MLLFINCFIIAQLRWIIPELFALHSAHCHQGGRGHWVVYYTSPQSLIIKFYYFFAYQPWGLLLNFDWLVHLVERPK